MHTPAVGLSQSPSAIDLFVPKTTSAASANASGASTTAPASSGSGLDGTTTGTTFLSLLVHELQNQDPSAPMDSTQMVGQMISLNQLDQLISINTELNTKSSSTTTPPTPPKHGVSPVANAGSQTSAQLVADRNALLNESSLSAQVNPANLAVSNPNMTLDLSSLTNQIGGK